MNLTGQAAVAVARAFSLPVQTYADPLDNGGPTPTDSKLCADKLTADPALIYLPIRKRKPKPRWTRPRAVA